MTGFFQGAFTAFGSAVIFLVLAVSVMFVGKFFGQDFVPKRSGQ